MMLRAISLLRMMSHWCALGKRVQHADLHVGIAGRC